MPAPSPPPRPRTKPPEVRREELMDAAEKLFLAKGIAATSIDEIVAAADVAKGTFYIHFPSKEHLLIALRQRFVAGFLGVLQAAIDHRPPSDWTGRLCAWVEAGVDFYLAEAARHDIVFHEFQPDNRHAPQPNPVVDQLAQLLEQGNRAAAWSAEDPRLTAIMLFHALHGAVDAKTDIDRERLARRLETFFRRAVGLG